MITEQNVKSILAAINEPFLKKDYITLGFYKGISINGKNLILNLGISDPLNKNLEQVKTQIANSIKSAFNEVENVVINFILGVTNHRNDKKASILPNIKNTIAVASGKGGVGKSTVAANLAYALTRLGKKVALVDADIYGSSIPKILEMQHRYPNASEDGKILPFEAYGMEIISTEFFAEIGKPIIWRGAMLNSMMNNFFYEVKWNKNIDYMIIDSPPGTGDIALDLRTIIPTADVLIVTTPHLAASHVAIKAGYAAKQLGHSILGVIENMSYYLNPVNKQKDFLFGSGGGEAVAEKLETEVISQIPINQPLHHLGLYELDEEIGKIYNDLAELILYKTQ